MQVACLVRLEGGYSSWEVEEYGSLRRVLRFGAVGGVAVALWEGDLRVGGCCSLRGGGWERGGEGTGVGHWGLMLVSLLGRVDLTCWRSRCDDCDFCGL